MILTKKHIKLSESLFGISAIILRNINNNCNIDELYTITSKDKLISKSFNFEIFVLALDFLFLIGIVSQNETGVIYREID